MVKIDKQFWKANGADWSIIHLCHCRNRWRNQITWKKYDSWQMRTPFPFSVKPFSSFLFFSSNSYFHFKFFLKKNSFSFCCCSAISLLLFFLVLSFLYFSLFIDAFFLYSFLSKFLFVHFFNWSLFFLLAFYLSFLRRLKIFGGWRPETCLHITVWHQTYRPGCVVY